MGFASDNLSTNAKGGTELQKETLKARLKPELLDRVQIYTSRIQEERDPDKFQIFWAHDLAEDPAVDDLIGREMHRFVFVSDWQMNEYNIRRGVPYGNSVVIKNGIVPTPKELCFNKPTDKIRLIYHTTPHRGLNILIHVFNELCKVHDDIELDVYSSFAIYGWGERDKEYEDVLNFCKEHPKINYHGSVPNSEIRQALNKAHIFAYPSIWKETSCIALMEAMSSNVLCIHPNLAALPETSGGMTSMYQWHEDPTVHANRLYYILDNHIKLARTRDDFYAQTLRAKWFSDLHHDVERTVDHWQMLLASFEGVVV